MPAEVLERGLWRESDCLACTARERDRLDSAKLPLLQKLRARLLLHATARGAKGKLPTGVRWWLKYCIYGRKISPVRYVDEHSSRAASSSLGASPFRGPASHRLAPTRATPTRDAPYRTARRYTALHGTAPRRTAVLALRFTPPTALSPTRCTRPTGRSLFTSRGTRRLRARAFATEGGVACQPIRRAAPREAHSVAPGTGCSVLHRVAPRRATSSQCGTWNGLLCTVPHRTARLRRASTHRVP